MHPGIGNVKEPVCFAVFNTVVKSGIQHVIGVTEVCGKRIAEQFGGLAAITGALLFGAAVKTTNHTVNNYHIPVVNGSAPFRWVAWISKRVTYFFKASRADTALFFGAASFANMIGDFYFAPRWIIYCHFKRCLFKYLETLTEAPFYKSGFHCIINSN